MKTILCCNNTMDGDNGSVGLLSGVQKQREEHEAKFVSVGGLVEKGLQRLRPESNIAQLYFSSRTDTGECLLLY